MRSADITIWSANFIVCTDRGGMAAGAMAVVVSVRTIAAYAGAACADTDAAAASEAALDGPAWCVRLAEASCGLAPQERECVEAGWWVVGNAPVVLRPTAGVAVKYCGKS
jgi:hypothetical protein